MGRWSRRSGVAALGARGEGQDSARRTRLRRPSACLHVSLRVVTKQFDPQLAQAGDVAREALRRLNRRHLEHLSKAPQHAQDRPPPPLNDLEGAVARVSLDGFLSEDEETLRTLGDQPVLIWHSAYSDPPDLDRSALTPEEDLSEWVAMVTPPGCRKLGPGMTDIRRYDGDASTVLSRWSVGGESPTSSSESGTGGRGGAVQAVGAAGQRSGTEVDSKRDHPEAEEGELAPSSATDRSNDEEGKGSTDAPASASG